MPHPASGRFGACHLRAGLTACLALLAATAGAGPPPARKPPAATRDVTVVVFYDENGNGVLDASEAARIPGVVVQAGGRSARSEPLTGRAVLTDVPQGTHLVSARAETLPRPYEAGSTPLVTVPRKGELALPVTLPIGANLPNVYLAFGDSITAGEGSSDELGYRVRLEARLRAYFGRATVVADGVPGTTTGHGVRRIRGSLAAHRPAWTLILYGTNDWNGDACNSDIAACDVLDNLARIVMHVRNAGSLPVLATIPPANTGFDDRAPADRNIRVEQMNDQIRTLARAQGVVLADLFASFMATRDLARLFVDHVHPSDAGYELIAEVFFAALTHPGAAGPADGAPAPQLSFARPAASPGVAGASGPARPAAAKAGSDGSR